MMGMKSSSSLTFALRNFAVQLSIASDGRPKKQRFKRFHPRIPGGIFGQDLLKFLKRLMMLRKPDNDF